MAHAKIEENAEEALFRLFNSAQDLERRIFRMIARGHFNELSVGELRTSIKGMIGDVDDLDSLATDAQNSTKP